MTTSEWEKQDLETAKADSVAAASTQHPYQRPIVVSGPSGVGKGTLVAKLLAQNGDAFVTTVSHTTRLPRAGELESCAYHFVTFDEFQSLIDQNAFVEHTFFSGNFYGTSWQTILDQQRECKGKRLLLEIDMNGVKNIKANATDDLAVRCAFITPPSLRVLEDRLRSRGTESDESIRKRLAHVGLEMEFATSAKGSDDVIIVNDDLDNAYRQFEEWALRDK